jgi:hypothetical protein
MSIDAVCAAFVSHLEFELSHRGLPKWNGVSLATQSNVYLQLLKAMPPDEAKRLASECGMAFEDAEVRDGIARALKVANRAAGEQGLTEPISQTLPYRLSDAYLYRSLQKASVTYFHCRATDAVFPVDGDSLEDLIKFKIGKDLYAEWAHEHVQTCRIGYRPFKDRLFAGGEDEADVSWTFNLWTPAPWEKSFTPPEGKVALPEDFKTYLRHFLADEESAYHVGAWLRDATFRRAGTHLVLAGTPGSGKTILATDVLSALVGSSNFKVAQRGFKASSFQASVTSCRGFYFDEEQLDASLRDTMKAYHNKKTTVERKHTEVAGDEMLYCSMVLSNNHPHLLKLDYSDRKFFTPLISDTPLKKSWGKKNIDAFTANLKDPEYVLELARGLHATYRDGESDHPPKNALFRKLAINSYTPAFRSFIRLCERQRTVTSREVNRGMRYGLDAITLGDMIHHYEVSFGERLATLPDDAINMQWAATSLAFKGKSCDDDGIEHLPDGGLAL